ncbi:MAG: sterol desaturase family protein [Balneolaceae bacterium]|nr:sterol desaturase family protein [Balneolaceae bacterium]
MPLALSYCLMPGCTPGIASIMKCRFSGDFIKSTTPIIRWTSPPPAGFILEKSSSLELFRIAIIALFGIYFWELVLYEIVMFTVVQFHHANIGLSHNIDRMLRAIIVTPDMHRVHHSRWQPETDSNYSSLFSFWDRIAKTFRLREKPEEIELGLDEYDDEKDQTVGGMLKTPLKKND